MTAILEACEKAGQHTYERLRWRAMILLMRYYGLRVSDVATLARSRVRRDQIAVRAIKRLSPHLEVRPVTSLAEAECMLKDGRVGTVFVASGLDDWTHGQTIRWFADNAGETIVIALLEHCDDRQRQEAFEAGASYICSKPDLLVAQLRREAASRLACYAPERPVLASR